MNVKLKSILQKSLHRKINKLEAKLQKLATIYFGEDMRIMYVKNRDLKKTVKE
jgi:hypothetical protein